jgi:hypothetical protein
MADVIVRLKAKAWFKELPAHEQDAAIDSLMRDPHAQDEIATILDNIKDDPSWAGLTTMQEQQQIMGVIELERWMRLQRESLEELEWYEDLGPGEQAAVRLTAELNARIQRATLRTIRRADEAQLQASNPWHQVLQQGRVWVH